MVAIWSPDSVWEHCLQKGKKVKQKFECVGIHMTANWAGANRLAMLDA